MQTKVKIIEKGFFENTTTFLVHCYKNYDVIHVVNYRAPNGEVMYVIAKDI